MARQFSLHRGRRDSLWGGWAGTGRCFRGRRQDQNRGNVRQALRVLEAGDQDIDIVGFSRGAALAVHFANVIEHAKIRRGGDANGAVLEENPHVRFLGLWDVVGSFGIPRDIIFNFQEFDLGYDLTPAGNLQNCYHAMALDERRASFRVTRLDKHGENDRVEELWFRGVHTDVGGGGGNVKLSNIARGWIMQKALDCGVPINNSAIPGNCDTDRQSCLSHNFDPIKDARRKLWPNDEVHESARSVNLAVGETQRFTVYAPELYSWSGVRLEKGSVYSFQVPAGETWKDKSIDCGAEGWTSEQLSWLKEAIVRRYEEYRRVPAANWFELIGSIDDDGDSFFRIGNGLDAFRAPESGDLYAFPNDLADKYGNNKGRIEVEIKRLT